VGVGGDPAVTAVVNSQLFISVFVTLVVIMDPLGTLPIFLALTATTGRRERIRAARQAVAVALVVIVLFAVFGQGILGYLHVTLPALQGAGGLLLVLVALQLLTGKTDEPAEQGGTSNVALVPIGTPLLAGPGAIVATMLFAQRASGMDGYLAVSAGIACVLVAVWLILRFSWLIVKVLRPAGIEVLTRIAGLLLAAIAVQLVADSVNAFVHAYRL